ncbi:MAG: PqqD family protein [Eubacterium sp.]|nr:PqqD family protein [Eubacterium sp.]MBR4241701.1 PqqD family protein [Eubacterium sp.]
MKIKDGFAKREIAGSHIVVPVGKTALEFNAMITLNESGAFYWDIFQNDITIDEAVKLILDEYEVEESRARTDVEKFIAMLEENELIE